MFIRLLPPWLAQATLKPDRAAHELLARPAIGLPVGHLYSDISQRGHIDTMPARDGVFGESRLLPYSSSHKRLLAGSKSAVLDERGLVRGMGRDNQIVK